MKRRNIVQSLVYVERDVLTLRETKVDTRGIIYKLGYDGFMF